MKNTVALLVAWVASGVVLVQAAAWLLVRRRWRELSKRLQARTEHRIAERERRFAALHDGLLQDVQGLTLSLHAVARQLPPEEPARQQLERILERADDLLSEGRRRVQGADSDLGRTD